MTPTQLRAFSAVVRHGSVKDAAAELGVTEAAVSLHVGQLRRELVDQLFTRTGSGLAFTPGGLRLATRAAEMLGLQDRTILEISQAGKGRRLMRLATSSTFAEHAAPGLIELFAARADDLDVELSVRPLRQFGRLLLTREIDIAIGPTVDQVPETLAQKPFLKYQIVAVAAPSHPFARGVIRPAALREQSWLLGPSAVEDGGMVPRMVRQLALPESQQQIFQSHSAALEEARRGGGIALALASAVSEDLRSGRLVRVNAQGTRAEGTWGVLTLPGHSVLPAADELARFVTTPRAMQAMLKGSGVNIGHFRPSLHVTLWN